VKKKGQAWTFAGPRPKAWAFVRRTAKAQGAGKSREDREKEGLAAIDKRE